MKTLTLQRKNILLLTTLSLLALSSVALGADISTLNSAGSVDVEWPWMKFFNSLASQLTGPLPMALGVMGIAGAAIALFAGHAGGATQKFIILIFAISIALFAPNFMSAISQSAGGMTITGM